jgi:hypothetical protein
MITNERMGVGHEGSRGCRVSAEANGGHQRRRRRRCSVDGECLHGLDGQFFSLKRTAEYIRESAIL